MNNERRKKFFFVIIYINYDLRSRKKNVEKKETILPLKLRKSFSKKTVLI
jgi:hypothetical protein